MNIQQADLGFPQHAHSLGGGLPVGPEAAQDADGLRHEAHVAHHRHPRAHNRSRGRLPRPAAPCAGASLLLTGSAVSSGADSSHRLVLSCYSMCMPAQLSWKGRHLRLHVTR